MKTNHITSKATASLGNLAADSTTSSNTSPQNSLKIMSPLDHPRYKANPIYLIFECYIEDAIGHLPEIKSKTLQEMNLQKVFKTKASDWKAVIRETLHLSRTIDIAIQDHWYQNREHFKNDEGRPDSYLFSQVFTDDFMADGSKIDVWPPGALDAAKVRIRRAKAKDMEDKSRMAGHINPTNHPINEINPGPHRNQRRTLQARNLFRRQGLPPQSQSR